MSILKRFVICLLGVLISFLLLSLFVELDSRFIEGIVNHSNRDRSIVVASIWRFNWIYNPLISGAVSLVVGLLGGKYRILLCLIAIIPFIAFDLAASSFRFAGMVHSFIYLLISGFVGFIISRCKSS